MGRVREASARRPTSWSSTTARPTAPATIADRLAAPTTAGPRPAPDQQGGARRGVPRGVRLGPASGRTTWSSRWTRTARTSPSSCRGCWRPSAAPTWCWGRAGSPEAGWRTGRPTGMLLSAAAATRTRGSRWASRCTMRPAATGPFGGPRWRPWTCRRRLAGLLLPGRPGLARRAARPAGRRGADHVRRAGPRRQQDERVDRPRVPGPGDRLGAAAPAGAAARPGPAATGAPAPAAQTRRGRDDVPTAVPAPRRLRPRQVVGLVLLGLLLLVALRSPSPCWSRA